MSRVHRRSALPALLLVVFAAVAFAEPGTISPDELARRIEAGDAPLVLDVRTVQEYSDGHIPGAVNIPLHNLDSRIDEIAEYREEEVVVHCRTGRRAKRADVVLEEAGFTKLLDLDGDWLGWRAAGHAAEKGAGQSANGAQVGGSK